MLALLARHEVEGGQHAGREDLERGRKVELRILGCDLVDLVMDSRLIRILDESASAEEEAAIEEALEEEEAAAGGMPENDGGNGGSDMPAESSAAS